LRMEDTQEQQESALSQLVDQCHYANAVPLSLTFVIFLHELSLHHLTFTKQGELNKKLLKQLHKQLQKYGDVSALRQLWQQWFVSKAPYDNRNNDKGSEDLNIAGSDSFDSVTLLLELAYDLGLLERNKQGLMLSRIQLKHWL